VSAKINVDMLQRGLKTRCLGRHVFFSGKVDSTNNWAKELASFGAGEGLVTVAETQSAGRGRLDREWISPAGGLWFSAILKPNLKPHEAVKLVFVAGLAVAEVFSEFYGLRVETKWPNDILVNRRKVCGLLAEMNTVGDTVNYVVIGIGVNANFDVKKALPEELWKNATSLQSELGRKVQLETLFRALLEKLEKVYELFMKEGFRPVLEEWKKYAFFLGRQVEVTIQRENVSGLALDVDQDGALVLKLENGRTKQVFVGDIRERTR